MDIEQKAKRSYALLKNDWFIETIQNLREEQKTIFANSSAEEVEKREDDHAILRALNAIEVSLKADVDSLTLLEKKGKHLG